MTYKCKCTQGYFWYSSPWNKSMLPRISIKMEWFRCHYIVPVWQCFGDLSQGLWVSWVWISSVLIFYDVSSFHCACESLDFWGQMNRKWPFGKNLTLLYILRIKKQQKMYQLQTPCWASNSPHTLCIVGSPIRGRNL